MAPYHGRQTMASENVFIDKNDHVNKEIVKLKQDVILRTGAYGQVCKALRGLHCAAKVFHPTLVNPKRPDERGWFEKECSLLRQIRHPNIIQSWGVHHDGATGRHIMLMGTSLDHLSEAHLPYSHGPSPFRDRDYLSYYMVFHDFALPTREIVHRNLSRNNAFIVPRERAKITDFGMSKLINPCKTPGTLWLGTPEYNVQNVLVDLLSKLNEMLESSKAHCDPSNQSTPIAAPIARNCVKVKYKEQPTAVQLCLCQTSLKTAAACSEGSIAKFHDHAMQQLQCQVNTFASDVSI